MGDPGKYRQQNCINQHHSRRDHHQWNIHAQNRLTCRHKQRIALDRIRMRRLLALELVEGALAQLARPDGRLAVLGQVLTRRDIVVDTVVHLGAAGAHQGVCEDPVGQEEGPGVVRGLLAGSGAEAEGGQDGPASVSKRFSIEGDVKPYDMIDRDKGCCVGWG